MSEKNWYVRMEDGRVYGPADVASLVEWEKDGRVEPTSFVSQDRKSWQPAQMMSELGMTWLIETEPGKVFGPFNRAVVISLFKNDRSFLSDDFKTRCRALVHERLAVFR